MSTLLTVLTAMAVLLFSFGVATLLEELFIGGLFKMLFASRPVADKKAESQPAQGGARC